MYCTNKQTLLGHNSVSFRHFLTVLRPPTPEKSIVPLRWRGRPRKATGTKPLRARKKSFTPIFIWEREEECWRPRPTVNALSPWIRVCVESVDIFLLCSLSKNFVWCLLRGEDGGVINEFAGGVQLRSRSLELPSVLVLLACIHGDRWVLTGDEGVSGARPWG